MARAAILLLAAGASLLALTSSAEAATQVPAGNLASDQTWTLSNSPYQLAGDLSVPRGVTLTIDAGTIVEAPGGARVLVQGDLRAFGNPASLVSFGSSGGSWGGIVVHQTGNITILNATVSAPDRGLLVQTSGTVYLADVTFLGVLGDAIAVDHQPRSIYLQKVTVEGASRGLVAMDAMVNITASRLTVRATSFCVVFSSASNIQLLNFSLSGCIDAAVNMSSVSDITLVDGNISEWNGAAVASITGTRVNITGNRLYTSLPGSGLRLVGLADSVIVGNIVETLALPGGATLPFAMVGIDIDAPTGPNRIEQNRVTTFAVGIRLKDAIFPQRLASNTVGTGIDTGIEVLDSFNQTILGNTISGRSYPFAVNVTSATTPLFFRHTLDLNNTANGTVIRYLLDLADTTIDLGGSPLAMFALVGARNVTVLNANLSHGIPALIVANSADVTVRDAAVMSNVTGVEVYNGTRTLLSNLTADGGMSCLRFRSGTDNRATLITTTRCLHGVLTEGQETRLTVDNITLSNGTVRVAFFDGVALTLRDAYIVSPETTAFSNVMTRVGRGGQTIELLGRPRGVELVNVTIEGASEAIVLDGFSNITLRDVRVAQSIKAVTLRRMGQVTINGSEFSGEEYGVLATNLTDSVVSTTVFAGAKLEGFFCVGCSNVTVEANTFSGNSVGLAFSNGSRSVIFGNFFFFNTLHATSDTAVNDFDNGTVGNLWDDYSGLDQDGNGIGDSPYVIAAGVDQDRYPIARYPDGVGPTANAGPDIIAVEDAPTLLNGHLSTDDVGIRVYLWSLTDHGTSVTVQGLSTRYVFRTPGTYTVTLTVIDWGANRASDSLVVTILDRTAPHADGGGDRTVDEDVAVVLDATASFDNDPAFPSGAAFTWWVTDINGTFPVFGRVASWAFATPGNFSVRLIVDDAAGYSDETSFKVWVLDKTPPVVGDLEQPTAVEDFPFRVYGSVVADNDPLWPVGRVSWFELTLQGTLLATTNATTAVFNVSEPGRYAVTYYVRDASGNVGASTLVFDVADITPPDLSLFVERTAEAGEPFPMDVSLARDNNPAFPAGGSASWTIQLANGSVNLDGVSVSYTFLVIGDWNVALHLRDGGGNLAERSFVVHVRDTKAPVASIVGPTAVEAGGEATFTAVAADPSGISSYAWFVTGQLNARAGATLNYRFFAPGSYQVTLLVEDVLGHIGNVSITLFVVDTTPPEVAITSTPALRNGSASFSVLAALQVAFLGVDPSGIASVEWSWGDGNITTGTSSSHVYGAAGNYTLLVRVEDGAGNANTTLVRVEVIAVPVLVPPGSGGNPGESPTSAGLPVAAIAALVAAGGVGGLLLGLRFGRGPRKVEEPKQDGG